MVPATVRSPAMMISPSLCRSMFVVLGLGPICRLLMRCAADATGAIP